MSSNTQLCTFTVDDLLFGVEVTQVQEVIRFQHMTQVPLAPRVIRGLINLRGQIVTAIDLRSCLGLAPRRPDELPMNVVIRGVEGSVSLLVDSIGDVIEVSEDSFETPPSTMHAAQREVIDAVCKLPGRLLLVLDPERAVMSAVVDSARTHVRATVH
jgi:purine-binding chemotaxis protein CheW